MGNEGNSKSPIDPVNKLVSSSSSRGSSKELGKGLELNFGSLRAINYLSVRLSVSLLFYKHQSPAFR